MERFKLQTSCLQCRYLSHYLFEILHTTFIVKNSENVIKVDILKILNNRELYFLKLKKGYQVSHVKIVTLC